MFFVCNAFRAIYFDSSLSLSLSLAFQSLFISQKHASKYSTVCVCVAVVVLLIRSCCYFSHTHFDCTIYTVKSFVSFFPICRYSSLRFGYVFLSSLVSFALQLSALRLMCTKSEIRVVWPPNQRQSAENKQMIRFSMKVGVIFAKRFSPVTKKKEEDGEGETVFGSEGHKSERLRESKQSEANGMGGRSVWENHTVTGGMYILVLWIVVAVQFCQIDGWLLHWLPSHSNAHTIHYPFLIHCRPLAHSLPYTFSFFHGAQKSPRLYSLIAVKQPNIQPI